jgi:hypothetical protein
MGDILGGIGSIMNAGASVDAAKAAGASAEAINAANLELARQARGEGGLPVGLPLYTGNFESGTLFPQLSGAYMSGLQSLGGSPADIIAKNNAVTNKYQGAMAGAGQQVNDLFSGKSTANRLGELAPVASARLGVAGAQKQGINTDLQVLKNRADALASGQGFVGGSTFNDAARYRAALPDFQAAAGATASAQYQNAVDKQGIQQAQRELALANVGLPSQMASQQLALNSMGTNQAVTDLNNLYGVMSPLRMTEWKPPTMQNLPPPSSVSVAGTALGAAGNVLNGVQKSQADQANLDWLKNYLTGQQQSSSSQANTFSSLSPSWTTSDSSTPMSSDEWLWNMNSGL